MPQPQADAGDTAPATTADDLDPVAALVRELVRIPSRGGIDPYEPIITRVAAWLTDHDLVATVVTDQAGAAVGLTCEVRGAHPGPRWVLDACLDTAPFGDEAAWLHPPTSGHVDDGWLWGRGSADSKAGVAIFCHVAAQIATVADDLHGTLVLLFDVDEHTGVFGGARSYFDGPGAPHDVAGVMIGYPGQDVLVVGGRGVHRVRIQVYGVATHTGARTATPNAVAKAADLVRLLTTTSLPVGESTAFPLPGRLTVTAVHGGQGFSMTPDLCNVHVDIRTTPQFDDNAAADHVRRLVEQVDAAWSDTRASVVEVDTQWPPYSLPEHSSLREALVTAAAAHGLPLPSKIAGPSNIGNYLAQLGIPATAGFGVTYAGLHATDERIRLNSIPVVRAVYHTAVRTLLGRGTV